MVLGRVYRWPQSCINGDEQRLWYGADYNPEQWPSEVWDDDIRLMRQAHVNIVSLGIFSWSKIEVSDGVYDFSWLDIIIDKLGKAGIFIDLATATASPPIWLITKYPEVLWQDEYGHVCWPGARQHWRPTSPIFKKYAVRLCEKIAQHYKDNPYIVAWHINNEYGCHNRFDYSEDARRAFQKWCMQRYGDIDSLNNAWGTAFWSQCMTSFDEILPPRFIGEGNFINPTQLLDFKRFSSDMLKEFLIAERDVLKTITPHIPVTTNFMIWPSGSIQDYDDVAECVDFVSNDHYFCPGNEHLDELSFSSALVDGISHKNPWFLMEHSTSAVNWRGLNHRKNPGELIRDSLAHVAFGADAVCYFQWRASQAGAEKFHSAMVPHAGENTQIYRDVCTLGHILETLKDSGLLRSRLRQSRIAIMYDYQSQWAMEHTAMPYVGLKPSDEAFAWFEALLDSGITADIVPVTQNWDTYELVVIPSIYLMDTQTIERIHTYVRSGGKIIVTYLSCISDMNDHVYAGGYGQPLSDITGVYVEEFAPMGSQWQGALDHLDVSCETRGQIEENSLYDQHEQEIDDCAEGHYKQTHSSCDTDNNDIIHLTAHDFADVITDTYQTARILARYHAPEYTGLNNAPSIVAHTYGNGKSVYVGCRLGKTDLARIMPNILFALDMNIEIDANPCTVMRTERISNDGTRFIFLFNRTKQNISVNIEGEIVVAYCAEIASESHCAEIAPAGVIIMRVTH